jgi:Protein of unknown function (DUF2846)
MKTIIILLFAVMVAVAGAQEPPAVGEATIYVYRNAYHKTFGKEAAEVSANGEKLARLDVERYFVARVPAGLLIVTSGKKKDNRVEIEAKAGETYYLRVRAHPGQMFARFELFRVTKEEAKADADKLRYVEAGDIKSVRVVKDAPKP